MRLAPSAGEALGRARAVWRVFATPSPPSYGSTMSYSPGARGPHPVGVRTTTISYDARSLDVEVWFPADDAHRGQELVTPDEFHMIPGMPSWRQRAVRDARPRDMDAPLVVFSHGYSSHRRQSTELATHLASHGYVVAAPDHAGNTVVEVYLSTMGKPTDEARRIAVEGVIESAAHRPRDVAAVLDAARSLGARGERAAVVGHSFGGWTALSAPAHHAGVGAIVALAPAGGPTPTYPDDNPLESRLSLAWGREVPTLIIAAELDSILPLDGVRALAARLPTRADFAVLERAEHLHFLDHAGELHELFRQTSRPALYGLRELVMRPFEELVGEREAHRLTASLTLAHLDAVVRGDEAARAWRGGAGSLSALGLAGRWE